MKTILITGASSGIGKETSLLFAEKGWNVAAAMRNSADLQLFADHKNITTYLLDVRNKESIKECIRQVIKDSGKIDIIVNNAGLYTINPLELTPDETIDNIIETNVKGVLYTTKAILEHFRENKSGLIINISSIAGRATFPFQTVYHTSKWAVEGFSESLYYELKSIGIKVKVVEPGVVRTNIYNSVLNTSFEHYPNEYQNSFSGGYNFLMRNYEKGYSPVVDARTIYKAANSKSSRLRYTSDFSTKFALALHSILPLSVFRKLIRKLSNI